MKHAKALNRKARDLERLNDREVQGLACGACCASFAPGWEVNSSNVVDPCPWQNDLYLCWSTCYWTAQNPDNISYPSWSDGCGAIANDWMNLCVVPD